MIIERFEAYSDNYRIVVGGTLEDLRRLKDVLYFEFNIQVSKNIWINKELENWGTISISRIDRKELEFINKWIELKSKRGEKNEYYPATLSSTSLSYSNGEEEITIDDMALINILLANIAVNRNLNYNSSIYIDLIDVDKPLEIKC